MLGLGVAGVFLFATDARATNTLYDMTRFLQEAHPFQNPAMAPAPVEKSVLPLGNRWAELT